MKKIQLSKSGKRRFNKRVGPLVFLLEQDEKLFLRDWHKQVQGWIGEIHRRAADWREGNEYRNAESEDGIIAPGRTEIFGVMQIAELYLAACGMKAERLVGSKTRQLLSGECVKAVALICDARLNFSMNDRLYRRVRVQ